MAARPSGIDDMACFREILVEETFPQAVPGIGEESGNGATTDFGEQLIYALRSR